MFKEFKKALHLIYNYVEERYSIKSIVSFILLGVAVTQIIIYFILDYFTPTSLILIFIVVAIPFSVFFISIAMFIFAFLGIQDKGKNSIFSYVALVGSSMPLIFLWNQNRIFLFLSVAITVSILLLVTYPIVRKILAWATGTSIIAYLSLILVMYRENLMEGVYKLALIPIAIIGIFSGDIALPFSTESIYFETLEMNGSKQVKDDGGQL